MCNAFSLCGHEVTLYVTNRKTDITESPEAFFGVPIHFNVERISVPDVAGYSPYIPKILHPIFFTFQRFTFARNCSRVILDQSFAYIYGRDEWVLWFLTFFAKRHIIWESHEARYSFAGRMLLKKNVPLIVISEGIRDFYLAKGVLEKYMIVAHDAVDDRFFAPHVSTEAAREFLHIDTQKPVVMYVGGLEEWKGAEILCQAGESQSTFNVYVVGGKEKEILQLSAKYPHVYFLGPRPYRDLPVVQQAADILVIPNTATNPVSERYTSPLKLFTYMTSKKPIVASDISSIGVVLSHDETYFFAPDNANDLKEVLLRAMTDKSMMRTKAENAYKKSMEHTWQARAKKILRFLGTVR